MLALTGGVVFDGQNFLKDKAVLVDGGKIAGLFDFDELPNNQNIEKFDCGGSFLSAGFIDLQINGCGGVLFNDDISEKTIETMVKTARRFGCTTIVPTLITAEEDTIRHAIYVAHNFYKAHPNAICGIHIEGPYISKSRSGTHNPDLIIPIGDDMVQYFCQKSRDIPIILTIAPEENDTSYIRKLAKAGVIVSIGHSNATFCRAAEAFANGAKMATHLFNAMSPFEGRQPGVVGAAFDSDVYAGIIIDGVHSDFASVRIAKKIKGNKLFIVTDAAASMGTNLTEFEFGGFKVFVKDGICRNENGALAGSNIDMMSSVKNAVSSVGIPLEEALRMATLYPAEVMGLDGKLGRIDKGMTANLVVFDKDFKVKSVFFEGVTASD